MLGKPSIRLLSCVEGLFIASFELLSCVEGLFIASFGLLSCAEGLFIASSCFSFGWLFLGLEDTEYPGGFNASLISFLVSLESPPATEVTIH